jgi:hypothetical protein
MEGLIMRKTILIAVAVLAISIGYAEAKSRKDHLPVCNASSALLEVLGDKCFLVKGSMIYGDIASLSEIITWPGR